MSKIRKLYIIITMILLVQCSISLLTQYDLYKMKYETNNWWAENFEEQIGSDNYINIIADKCRANFSKTKCVYDSIPFRYDFDKLEWKDSGDKRNSLTPPSEMMRLEGLGVCRDISAFRKLVLDDLNISNEYIFKSNHVYVRAYENGVVYDLDNSDLRTIDYEVYHD